MSHQDAVGWVPLKRGPKGTQLVRRLPTVGVLAVVWILLWGTWTWANLLTGLVVGAGITLLLPLPRVPSTARVHPGGLLRYLARMTFDLFRSSGEVAWLALRPAPPPKSAVVVIRTRSSSDFILAATAESICLVPGSLVLELVPPRRLIVVHVFDVGSQADVEAFRRDSLELEARIIRAMGGPEEIRRLDAELQARGPAAPGSDRRGGPS
jgi:multicomponent Na+:H+ antiporter subunit E